MRSYNQKVDIQELLKKHIINYVGPLKDPIYTTFMTCITILFAE